MRESVQMQAMAGCRPASLNYSGCLQTHVTWLKWSKECGHKGILRCGTASAQVQICRDSRDLAFHLAVQDKTSSCNAGCAGGSCAGSWLNLTGP